MERFESDARVPIEAEGVCDLRTHYLGAVDGRAGPQRRHLLHSAGIRRVPLHCPRRYPKASRGRLLDVGPFERRPLPVKFVNEPLHPGPFPLLLLRCPIELGALFVHRPLPGSQS